MAEETSPDAPVRPRHAELTLTALREFRRLAAAEETQVSYWRRLIQTRLDVLRAGAASPVDVDQLLPLLSERQLSPGRRALVLVLPAEDVPPLPDLAQLWNRQVDPDDAAGLAQLDADLSEAEQQLSAYRADLHQRIGEATAELIVRYRAAPALCLSALPVPLTRQRDPEAPLLRQDVSAGAR